MFRSLQLVCGVYPLLLLNFVSFVKASIECGIFTCYGYAYCCGASFDQCCFFTPVYHLWWFWFIWVMLFIAISSCSYFCWKRRYRNVTIIHRNVGPETVQRPFVVNNTSSYQQSGSCGVPTSSPYKTLASSYTQN